MGKDLSKCSRTAIVVLLLLSLFAGCRQENSKCLNSALFAVPLRSELAVIDTLQMRDDHEVYEVISTWGQDTFAVTFHEAGSIESIVPYVNHQRLGLTRIFNMKGDLKYVVLSSHETVIGFTLEFIEGSLSGYSERPSFDCEGGKGYGFDTKGRVIYSRYADCDRVNQIETVYEQGIPVIRSVVSDSVESTYTRSDSAFYRVNNLSFDTYLQKWPDTTF